MDRPLSQLKAPELIFQRREERPRCGKQRIVFLEAGEIQHRLSVQLVSRHAIPDALHCLRNGPPNRGAHLFELRPHRLGLRSNVLVDRLGNASFHTPILCLCMWFFLADIRLAVTFAVESLPDCRRAPLHRDRKSTRLNSSHLGISYAVFCLKKKKHTVLSTYT